MLTLLLLWCTATQMVLKVASVIGFGFSTALLAAVFPVKQEVAALDRLFPVPFSVCVCSLSLFVLLYFPSLLERLFPLVSLCRAALPHSVRAPAGSLSLSLSVFAQCAHICANAEHA